MINERNAAAAKFPEGFLWGAATASYQVEGGITNNDWAQSKMPPAGIACDHYNRFEEDFSIAKKLGMSRDAIASMEQGRRPISRITQLAIEHLSCKPG